MTFLGVDEDRIVRQLLPELQRVSISFDQFIKQIVPELRRVTNSFEDLMHVLMWAVVICLALYIWRQHAEEQRAKEVHTTRSSPKQPYTILADSAEATEVDVERLRRENEALKKAVHSQSMAIKQQSEVNKELKNIVNAGVAALTQKGSELLAKEEELRKVNDSFSQIKNSMSSFETMFQCQVCMDLLDEPYVLSPCGHVFCLHCLQEWFRRSPAAYYDDEENLGPPILSCPCCRTRVTHRPIPLFVLRDALAELRVQLRIENSPERPPANIYGDPWEGIFSSQGRPGLIIRF
ncbi:hypothetical protein F5887DRAFT_328061 [Amanita rubescens]|nr:hypothetical protein F5887DRAFT_328061 [Amanita rubescens]